MSILEKAKTLRSEAWDALVGSPDFAAFKASDDFVLALGGASAMPSTFIPKTNGSGPPVTSRIEADAVRRLKRHAAVRRVTQADAAAIALRDAGEPLHVARFMEATAKKGGEIKGANPLANFRSAVSKDPRFGSIMRDGKYFWWFKDEPLPPSWNETADPDLLAESAGSSLRSSQEGGEANATAT